MSLANDSMTYVDIKRRYGNVYVTSHLIKITITIITITEYRWEIFWRCCVPKLLKSRGFNQVIQNTRGTQEVSIY